MILFTTLTFLLLFIWVLFVLAILTREHMLISIAGMGMVMFSIYLMVHGIESVDNFVTKGLAVIQIGLGLVAMFAPLENLDGDEMEDD